MAFHAHGTSDPAGTPTRILLIGIAGFVAFVVLLAVLEQVGVPHRVIGFLFVFFTLAVYAGIGILSRTTQADVYFVAGRRVPALFNGMATAANWLSAAPFLGLAGTLYVLGYDGLAFVIGWSGGFVLLGVLIVPYLRRFGAYTVPDFLAARFGGHAARFLGVVVLLSCSLAFLAAQLTATGLVASRFLGIGFETAVFIGLAGILLCAVLGGMRAVTWTQVAQYVVLITAYLTPVVILSVQRYGVPVPQLLYGQALQEIAGLEKQFAASGETLTPYLQPFTSYSPLEFFGLILCLTVGTASLPHLLMRYLTTPGVRETRRSVGWSLVFVVLLLFTAPAYAAFAKLEVYQAVIGTAVDSLPDWIYAYGNLGLVKICGADATAVEAIKAACASSGTTDGLLRLGDVSIDRDVIVIATPEIAGLPYVIAGLVAAGALAATLSSADGLLLAISGALSHDLYYKMARPRASASQRLFAARILLILVAIGAAWLAATKPADILSMTAWSFSLAAAGNFPALVLGIWWKRCTSAGAVAGIVAGFGLTLFYVLMTRYGDMEPWFGVPNISAALFGLPAGFVVTVAVSLMTRRPSRAVQRLLDAVRKPGAPLTEGGDPRRTAG